MEAEIQRLSAHAGTAIATFPEVDRRKFYVEALEDATAAVGGVRQLSRFIGVEPATLERWLSGEEPPPLKAFLSALDAAGPYALGKKEPASGTPSTAGPQHRVSKSTGQTYDERPRGR
jgi:hypothetical protein